MKNFNQLSKTEKRVLIAKDALEQLFLEHYEATKNIYISQTITKQDRIEADRLLKESYSRDEIGINALEISLSTPSIQNKPCRVCAIGSCMASAIRFGVAPSHVYLSTDDNVDVYLRLNYEDFQSKLNKIFDNKTLRLMEAHFENVFVDEIEPFYSEWLGKNKPDVRLYGILKNVIKNKGKFIPPAKFDSKLKDRFKKEKAEYMRKVKHRSIKRK